MSDHCNMKGVHLLITNTSCSGYMQDLLCSMLHKFFSSKVMNGRIGSLFFISLLLFMVVFCFIQIASGVRLLAGNH